MIRIGDALIGDEYAVHVALEVGPTVDSLETALALARTAGDAAADALKCQLLDADRLVGQDTEVTYQLADGTTVRESMRAILRRRALTPEEWRALKAETDRQDLALILTVDFPETLALAVELGAHALKICSGDVGHTDWIRMVGRTRKPVLIDTGNATLGEVEAAVDAALSGGAAGVIVHVVPTGYPARLESINLRMIPLLGQLFADDEVEIGFSDHTPGWSMDLAALGAGARQIEKTLTLDRTTRGPEHMMSIEPHEAPAFVQAMRDVDVALGHPRRRVPPDAAKSGARRSAFTARDLPAGTVLMPPDLDWRRPGTGIPPTALQALLGRILVHGVPGGQLLRWEDLA